MEKDIALGSAGDVDFKFENGQLQIVASVKWAPAASGLVVTNSTTVTDDPKVILDKLVAALPSGLLQDLGKAIEAGLVALAPKA